MASDIKEKFNIEPELIRLSGGVYEIYLNDKLIYSKKETGAFPENKNILKEIEEIIEG